MPDAEGGRLAIGVASMDHDREAGGGSCTRDLDADR